MTTADRDWENEDEFFAKLREWYAFNGEGHHVCMRTGTMWTGSTPEKVATCPWCKPVEHKSTDTEGR